MCGIAGIASPSSGELISRMTNALVHRGPDGEGYYKDEHIALGHRRLSIIDLEGGAQPIANETGSLQLVCNGEIYNSPELREQLLQRGHRFRTATDVEVILHLYEDFGVDCVRRLQGMFAFALWDKDRRTLLLARDHIGQKPLFYARRGAEFVFASEPKAILASTLVAPRIDLDALWHYSSLRFVPDDHSFFAGIHKLPAATYLVWKDHKISTHRYWSPDFTRKLPYNEAELEEGLDELMRDTVRSHLLSDVRVGAFVSGGIDSSTVAAIMSQMSPEAVPAFSIGVEEQQFNELPYARLVSQKFDMEAHERVVKADLIHLMPSMIHFLDEPSDPFGVGVYLVSKLAAEQVKVVLCGDGGDENFAGYDRFAAQHVVDYYARLPFWLRKHLVSRCIRLIPESFGYKSLAQKALWLNEMSFHEQGGRRYAQSLSILRFTREQKDRLFSSSVKSEIAELDSAQKVLCHYDSENVSSPIDRMLYTDLMTRMPDHLLAIVDRMSMAHSLESRPPLVDYKLVEYAASLPETFKLRGRNLKYGLKKVAARYLPRELIQRQKQGFAFPIGTWLRTDLRRFTENLFAHSRFVELGIFNQDCMQSLVREHMEGKADHNYRLWILINLEFWYRHNFEQQSVQALEDLTDSLMSGAKLASVPSAAN